jgi:hypothetical protein
VANNEMGPILIFRFILRFFAKDFATLESAQLKDRKKALKRQFN